jgi:2-polyprenyl-6-methoxyphenol hydroxylase-like FAD-dependent oxidoreductase
MKREHAIVTGASVAGLLSARILSEHFASVTIIERDKLPLYPEKRRGVPQSVQPHVLLTRGYKIIEELFPGIGLDLSSKGAPTIDWVREFYYFTRGHWSPKLDTASDITSFTCSRPFIEWAVRIRLHEMKNIKFIEEHRVVGLIGDLEGLQVTGLKIQNIVNGNIEELSADLVVDASGRASNANHWLTNLGFPAPTETVINPFLGYATRRYKQPPNFTGKWKVMLISQEAPYNKRLGYLAKIENGEWIATLGGYGHDYPPLDDAGYLEFAKTLASSEFYEAIKTAEPTSPIYAHRATANRWRHYEKIEMPSGFIALGDAVCALCPVYGQGMTVAALSAMVLRDWLQTNKLVTSRFQQRLAKSNQFHWMLATQQDSQFPTTVGAKATKSNFISDFIAWYNRKMVENINIDPNLYKLFTEVSHLLKSPLALYHPKIILKVLTQK